MKKIRTRDSRTETKKGKRAGKLKLSVYLAGCLCALVFMYSLCDFKAKKIDFNDLEYVIALPSDRSEIPLDLKDPILAFKQTFSKEEIERVRRRYVIIQSKYKNKLVANVFIIPQYYRNSSNTRDGFFLCFEIYNVYVAPKYRGQKLSVPHLYRSFKLLKEIYRVKRKQKSYLLLHISPKDKDMSKAYALYRTNGFMHGLFTQYGSYSLRKRSEVFSDPQSIDSVVRNYPYYNSEYKGEPLTGGDKFISMFTEMDTFFTTVEMNAYTKRDYEFHKNSAEKLRKPLLKQHKYV
ncbi:hypothetical protein NEMIN01_0980 [Nematocida minor]|uniref:uncharacterized protein n=1 Tax=Nematocida minor TaxID=1912983 RepID=UPI00221F8997|nr:uncharacterized protein NEMIN01_0980 [Nematocida minor]KAI5190281.1 hypothetical protein NEMIN01_0980 [Nematocida minor]